MTQVSVPFSTHKISEDCEISSDTAIGYPGFGIQRDKTTGIPFQIPHNGTVRIGKGCRIGSYVCIDRGTVEDTIIGDNVMIDNLVHIGHNAKIGEGTIIVAHTVVGGSATIGKNCFIGEGALIKQHITIGDQAIVAMGSVVIRDVPSKDIVAGNPAKSIKDKCNLSKEDRFRMVGY